MRPLRDLFVSGGYKDDLNEDNPLGHNGKLAAAYGNLMEMVYSGQGNKVAPRGFKKVIGEFEPQFQGFNQHDSQELLNFLLDGLHGMFDNATPLATPAVDTISSAKPQC
jgi:ubiquitin C-terminal hydrolase